MAKLAIKELVLDYTIYPRADVDSQHVSYIKEAYEAGVKLPPIIIDKKSKRVTDGFHRVKMYRAKYGDNYKIDCIEKSYKTEQELLLDAIRCNSGHGRTLSRYDRTHCILLAEKLKVPEDELASALCMTIEKIGTLRTGRIGELRVGNTREQIPLKRTIRHMSGRTMTKRQQEANTHLGGMNQGFYVNQLIILIESNLLDLSNDNLIEQLNRLYELMGKMKGSLKVKAAS